MTKPPLIVADFEFEGQGYLVVFWPSYEHETDGEPFMVYQDDLPWGWRHEAVDVRFA